LRLEEQRRRYAYVQAAPSPERYSLDCFLYGKCKKVEWGQNHTTFGDCHQSRRLSERNLLNLVGRDFSAVNYFLSSEASLVCVHELPIPSLHVGSTAAPSSLIATMASRRALGEVHRRRNGTAGPVSHLFCLRSSGWPRASGLPSAAVDALAAVRLLRGRGEFASHRAEDL
jgi:hypothetical protein